ncbi:recombinase family protein [Actinoplanes sp. NPDC049316]|uniref:recombinase family protein n=1 Tax=Actinoplanes sp. NPDC049316 TaxID=3154727 RepID=UPI00341C29BA
MTLPERLLRVALYARADTMALAAEQAERLLQIADSAPNWRVVAAFYDITADAARPGRTGVLSAASASGFDLLLVGSLDRLTRSTDELHDLISHLTAANVLLCTVGQRSTGQTRGDGDRPDLFVVAGGRTGPAAPIRRPLAGRPLTALPGRPDGER